MAKIKGKESGHQSLAKRARTPSLSSRPCQTCKSALGKLPPTPASTSQQHGSFGTSLPLKNRQIMPVIAASSGMRRDVLFCLPLNNGILPNQGAQPPAGARAATPQQEGAILARSWLEALATSHTHGGPGSCCSHPRRLSLPHGPLLGTWRLLRMGWARSPSLHCCVPHGLSPACGEVQTPQLTPRAMLVAWGLRCASGSPDTPSASPAHPSPQEGPQCNLLVLEEGL